MAQHLLVFDPADRLSQHPILDAGTLLAEAGYPALHLHRTGDTADLWDGSGRIHATAVLVAPSPHDETSPGLAQAFRAIPCLAVGVTPESQVHTYLAAGYLEVCATIPASVEALQRLLQRAHVRHTQRQRTDGAPEPGPSTSFRERLRWLRHTRSSTGADRPDHVMEWLAWVLMDQVAVPILLRDEQGRIIGFNRAGQELTGYAEADVLNRGLDELIEVEEPSASAIEPCLEAAGGTALPRAGERWRCQTRWVRPDGSTRHIAWVHQGLAGPEGGLYGVVSTGWDITEREQAHAHQHRTLLELAHTARISSVGEMTRQISHEITQPIGAIAMTADSLDGLCAGEEAQLVEQGLQDIVNQADRALRLIRGIRDFSRRESPPREPLDLAAVIDGVVPILSSQARHQGVRIEQAIAEGVPRVNGERVLLQQLILNLLQNALEAMRNNQGTRILLRVLAEGAEVRLEVQDSGPGIEATAWDHLFQSFYTTKSDGLGLGLAVGARIVQEHQGRIQAYNRPEGGSSFVVYLPAAEAEAEGAG
jgi:PAS domain S-box-containing protein